MRQLNLTVYSGQGGMAGTGNAKPGVNLGDEDLRRSEFFRLPWVSYMGNDIRLSANAKVS
jgi:hypothetical protein